MNDDQCDVNAKPFQNMYLNYSLLKIDIFIAFAFSSRLSDWLNLIEGQNFKTFRLVCPGITRGNLNVPSLLGCHRMVIVAEF